MLEREGPVVLGTLAALMGGERLDGTHPDNGTHTMGTDDWPEEARE